jgi:hypothetical protein
VTRLAALLGRVVRRSNPTDPVAGEEALRQAAGPTGAVDTGQVIEFRVYFSDGETALVRDSADYTVAENSTLGLSAASHEEDA